jgi:hypothetical protein
MFQNSFVSGHMHCASVNKTSNLKLSMEKKIDIYGENNENISKISK